MRLFERAASAYSAGSEPLSFKKASIASSTASTSSSLVHLPWPFVDLLWISSGLAPLMRTSKLPVVPGSRRGVTVTTSAKRLAISAFSAW